MHISIIGTGYVGLASGTCFAEMGNNVICVDNNAEIISKLNSGKITIYEPGLDLLFERNITKKRLHFTTSLEEAFLKSEIIFLCLPTPQGEDGSADLTHVLSVSDELGKLFEKHPNCGYKIVVTKSTVPVGTGDKVENAINKYGKFEVDVISNPEFLREGFAVEDFMKPDRIVIGSNSTKANEMMQQLYASFVRQGNPILFMDRASAEVTKYAANSYLAMRITFMNELANFCEKVGADVDNVRRGMGSDTRIGKRFLFPGIGYGGSCFPKDVNALIKTSKDAGSPLKILTVVDEVNKAQKLRLVEKVLRYFNNDIKGKHFAVWGLSFKPNTDDMREAPSISIIKSLLQHGATVAAYDPAAMGTAAFYLNDSITYGENEYSVLNNADALLILTEWNEFRNPDFDQLKNLLKNKLIFDGRNIFSVQKMKEEGFTYYSIGRK